jgi:hypothetical protein
MRNDGRLGLVLVLTILFEGAAVYAQSPAGAADGTQGSVGAGSQPGVTPGTGVASGTTAQTPVAQNPLQALVPPKRPNRTFNRMTTTRVEAWSTSRGASPGARSGAKPAASKAAPQSGALHPYTTQALRGGDPQVPSTSSWHQQPKQPSMMVRARPQTFYPGVRNGQHPNADQVTGHQSRYSSITPGRIQAMATAKQAQALFGSPSQTAAGAKPSSQAQVQAARRRASR